MAAPIGNKFWMARSSFGRKPIFEDPEQIMAGAIEYFEWVAKNPLQEEKIVSSGGKATRMKISKMRAMTIDGLCNFLDIGTATWRDYRKKEAFSSVCARVEGYIRQQKFEGASADLLNPAIIARDLGLADRQEHTGKDGAPLIEKADPVEQARAIAFMLRAAKEKMNDGESG